MPLKAINTQIKYLLKDRTYSRKSYFLKTVDLFSVVVVFLKRTQCQNQKVASHYKNAETWADP